MRHYSSKRSDYSDEENPYWISFSDIMAGLLVLFILAAVALILELTLTQKKVDAAIVELALSEQIRKNILHEIIVELEQSKIHVELSENDTVLRIPEGVLYFESGKHDISDDLALREVILKIGSVLFEKIQAGQRWKYLDTVFIEGHTDRRFYNNAYLKGNWGLSTFRAISVWDFWNKNMQESGTLDSLKNHSGSKLFSVSGYAETRPVTESQNTEQEFKKNRRIDIRFTVKRPKLEELSNISDMLGRY